MATGVVTWSTTAASNSTADSNVNWAEGQAPSSVNDSARAMMASVAKFRDDTNGSITTGGTSTAFTVTSNQSFASLSAMGNAVIAFVPHTTSGAAPTLAVDGLTAKGIRLQTGVDLPSGVLIQGTPYVVTYFASAGEFILHNIGGDPYAVPLGVALPFFGSSAPNSSFVLPYGQAISRTTYSTLFTMFSTTYGSGDGSTTFNVPDLRGRVVAGKDDMGGSDAGRLSTTYFGAVSGQSGSTLGHTGGAESHTLTAAQAPANMTGSGTVSGDTSVVGSSNFAVYSGSFQSGTAASVNGVADSGINKLSMSNGTVSVTVNSGGGSAHPIVQPTIIGNWLLRII
jgi:microcystin-dependent protein